MVHLFRTLSHAPLSSPGARSTTLFVVAVPNYFSPDDFIRFSGPRIDDVSELRFIRKAEVCHIIFLHEVDSTESADVASMPPLGFTELPSCPVCLERLDPDTSGILRCSVTIPFIAHVGLPLILLQVPITLLKMSITAHILIWLQEITLIRNVVSFCNIIRDAPLLTDCEEDSVSVLYEVCRLCQQQDEVPSCFICGTKENLWVCLICGFVGCGRYNDKHAISHWKNTQHCYSLDLRTQQIWDYVGDTYVHWLNQSKADGKLLEMNSYYESLEGDCSSCGCSEDFEISGALFSSKIEAIHTDYIHLASTQLEAQRKHNESLMLEAKSRKENSRLEAIEKAVTSKIEDIHSKLGKLGDEKKAVAELNQTLIKNQDMTRRKVKEIEERYFSC
ncbi:hypothetical protein EUGRSUZ_C01362 [Eucalyptus grandis]|uniref:Uncharacterized protein n=2 Tax=Eucalyptus grandis TaxID=71139 RepID=A0ACC3LEZ8_EUCGR|nr:hypothetical protein EUGRSUZ_C01362 [Eucalyptus grandis]